MSSKIYSNVFTKEEINLIIKFYESKETKATLLPVDVEHSWRLGDILTWNRNQLHISANFTRVGVTKKFLVLFIA